MPATSNQVLVYYSPYVDGWVRITKAFPKPINEAHVTEMSEATWATLATHATRDGEFYIPCNPLLEEDFQLRSYVQDLETNG